MQDSISWTLVVTMRPRNMVYPPRSHRQTTLPPVTSWPPLLHSIVRPRPRNPLAVTDDQGERDVVLRRAWYPSLHHKFGNSHLRYVCWVAGRGGGSGSTSGCQERGGNEKSAQKQRSDCVSLEENVTDFSRVWGLYTHKPDANFSFI